MSQSRQDHAQTLASFDNPLSQQETCSNSETREERLQFSSQATQRWTEHLEILWKRYVHWAHCHRSRLWLLDALLERICDWCWIFPTAVSNSSERTTSVATRLKQTTRSLLWALLQLHRLALDLALSSSNNHHSTSGGESNNRSSSPSPSCSTSLAIPLTLSTIQSLWPLLMSWHHGASCDALNLASAQNEQFWERIKFILRAALLWKRWFQKDLVKTTNQEDCFQSNGGRWLAQPRASSHGYWSSASWSLQQEERHRTYNTHVGRRTGTRYVWRPLSQHDKPSSRNSSWWKQRLLLLLGELLYILRPLLQAEMKLRIVKGSNSDETNHHDAKDRSNRSTTNARTSTLLWSCWVQSVGMDVASLLLLWLVKLRRGHPPAVVAHSKTAFQSPTRNEWNRRQGRLWLHLLRSPFWDVITQPFLTRSNATIDQWIPFLGPLLTAYYMDWIWWWKDYRLEEG